ncbi:MAG: hypothetical protein MZV64_10490 [Ignavibacteriales bacterium]|nr:hypothetical protein [Ignavibacteriales bacterium]
MAIQAQRPLSAARGLQLQRHLRRSRGPRQSDGRPRDQAGNRRRSVGLWQPRRGRQVRRHPPAQLLAASCQIGEDLQSRREVLRRCFRRRLQRDQFRARAQTTGPDHSVQLPAGSAHPEPAGFPVRDPVQLLAALELMLKGRFHREPPFFLLKCARLITDLKSEGDRAKSYPMDCIDDHSLLSGPGPGLQGPRPGQRHRDR